CEAKMASIMNAYQELDGVPCAISKKLLNDILRDEWGFEGTVVSDYFAINMLIEYHYVARNKIEAARMALEAGIDVELPSTDCFGEAFRQAVEKGDIRQDLVDQALRRVLTQKIALGVFEAPYVDVGKVAFDTPDQRQLAHEIAQKSIILLKNDDLLPLAKDTPSIAVIGPNADQVRNLFGDYAYPAHIESLMEMRDRNNVFDMPIPADFESVDDFIPVISVLQAIREKVSSQTQVAYAKGCDVLSESTEGFAEAVAIAHKADVALLIVGDKGGITADCTSGEARDRAEIGLPGVQEALVKAIVDTGTPVVLVLINGRPVTLDWMAEDIPAIVEAWFPAEEGGNAIADMLFGDVNPGGKLPISFPRAVGQIPVYYGHKPSGGRSHWLGDYVSTSSRPLYPFGHGLSYTTFAFDTLRIEQAEVKAGEAVTIRVDVRNVGGCAGDEVVQLYIHKGSTSVTRPMKQLKGFKRVTLQPGETKTITFVLAANQLAFYDRVMDYVLEPGPVEVMIGSSSEDIHLTGSFTVVGDTTVIHDKTFFSTAELG
ncbi:MAG: glycoside hydrolase family 3 C-terminal domain-containing protein, partial [Melioribacteraceae bacterium]|nr:glycoside hydrolase family 3 C-terminal domain-containing protein [Melioribacteraceae bacterium]